MMISLKYVLAPRRFYTKFLETSCKNLCACTTVVIIHIDCTVNHRFICTSGSYTSPHTQYAQLHNSQANFYRKGGPRAKADLPNLLTSVIFHHLSCKVFLYCFKGSFGALAASVTDIQKYQQVKKLLLTAGLLQVGSKCNTPWTP